ncbi:MAG: discoidin domain-containing protein [Clostridia bacterium]|nr:discoidin domain-containing protein [Clostridia bacterium]
MTTRNRILSLALSLLMVVALFAPIATATVFAAESLEIIKASDNGGTTATGTAREAIAGLGTGTSWYSANRNILTDKVSIATYTLKQSASVDSVAIAFYYADQRSFQFSVEYSMDKEIWEVALDKTWSTQQTTDKTAETFAFPEAVEALYLRVKIYDARVIATGAQNNYGAFYTFEAFGEFDPDGIVCPSTICPEGEVWAITAYQTEGPLHTNIANQATAACPNLRLQDDAWFSANAASTNTVAAVFVLPIETELIGIDLDWYLGDERGYEYALYTSLDGQDWTEIVAPGTISEGLSESIDLTADDDYEGSAIYVKIVSEEGYCQNADGTPSTNGWIALSEIRFIGEFIEGGLKPPANYDEYNNWVNIQSDLTEDLYTTKSWTAFDTAINSVSADYGLAQQKDLDAAVAAIAAAYSNLKFNNVSEIQIAQSYWSDLAGGTSWTNGAIIFTEPGYTLDQYKVKGMTIQNWTRISAEPTEEAGIFTITSIIESGVKPASTEGIPENDFGTGFVIALNYNGNNVNDAGSQYASEEFGNRNEAARIAMDLKVGDKVQLNNVLFSAEDFENEGEEMQAAWLETEGTWKHRYWDVEGLGDFTPTIINRESGQKDDLGNYLARDEFDGFVSYSTLTKVADPAEFVYAEDNGGTTATSTAKEAVAGLGSGTSWYSANRNILPNKISTADFYFAKLSAVEGIEIAFYQADQRTYSYSIEYTTDSGETWETIVEKTNSALQAEDKTAEEIYFDDVVEANAIRVSIYDATVVATGVTNNYGAFYSITPYATEIVGGESTVFPGADYSKVETWNLIKEDVTEEFYTEDSWKAFVDAIAAVTEGYDIFEQELLDAEVEAIREAYFALTFKDLEGIQISHSYYSDMTGGPAWTNASLFFSEPGYTLDQYKVSGMALTSWIRIFAAPTDKAGVYEITNVLAANTPVTADEMVPENDYGTGFVIALNINEDIPDEVPYGSQYASQEFANRNKAAFEAMNLAVGDLVQLNNVLFSAEDFENEGEDMQAAWIETTGTWKHRYWNTEGLGDFTPTVINRPSNKTNSDGAYIARDEFDGFTTASTLTKYEAPAFKLGDLDDDGEVGLSDLTLMSQTLAGWESVINELAADLDGDGEIGLSDLTVISQLLAGWDVEL